ncbi:MAG: DsbC/DsbD-like thiol-disulfide interchange protein [Rubritalea sp.]|jgi:DsbC/DsbD-like thiol-disulfide interchange protein
MMIARNLLLVFLAQTLVWGTCIASETEDSKKTKGLDITLLSEQSSIAPGSKFTLGVRIEHEKGFHTYWENPGVVGMATSIKWKLPEGFSVEPIQWPYPELSSMAGHPCHGYERDVMLMVEIQAPENLSGKEVRLTASLAWMCCADDCFPGFKDLSVTLMVSANPMLNKKNVLAFNQARNELPLTNCPWEIVMLSQRDQAVIKIRLRTKPGSNGKDGKIAPRYIFSDDGQISSDKKQQFIKQDDGSYLFTIDRYEYSPKLKKEFAGVLKAGDYHYSFQTTYKH